MKKTLSPLVLCFMISACASPHIQDTIKQVPAAEKTAPQEVQEVLVRTTHSPIVLSAIQRLLVSDKINKSQSEKLDKSLKQIPDNDYALIVEQCSKAMEELILTRCDKVILPFLSVNNF